MRDESGQIIDRVSDEQASERGPFLLHRLLGRRLHSFEVSPPNWLEVKFEGGLALRIIDDSEQYESFEIQPIGLIV